MKYKIKDHNSNSSISMMENHNFRETLGITQQEMGMLLKITKSQVAMFEIGQRDLPVNKMLKLVTMYNYVHTKQKEKSTSELATAEQYKCAAIVEQELRDTEAKLIFHQRELEGYINKCQKNTSILELLRYLETELPIEERPSDSLIRVLRNKALKGIEKNGLSVQLKCELSMKALQQYQKELKKELQRYK